MSITASQMGKLSWEKRKSPEELLRLKEISKKGVEARKMNKAVKSTQTIKSEAS